LAKRYLCQRADAWLSGHSHHLEHLKPEGCRLDLFVVGGGGGDLYQVKDLREDSRFSASQHGFLELEVSEREMVARYVDDQGKVLDETKKAPPSP
jgi:hypothetical protein